MALQEPQPSFKEALRQEIRREYPSQVKFARAKGFDQYEISRIVNGKRPTEHVEARPRELFPALPAIDRSVEHFDVFVAAPSRALRQVERLDHYNAVVSTMGTIRSLGLRVYWTTEGVIDPTTQFDIKGVAGDINAEHNYSALSQCTHLVYMQYADSEAPNGALVELGYALGRGLSVIILLSPARKAPHNVLSLEAASLRTKHLPSVRLYVRETVTELQDLLASSGGYIFDLEQP